MTRKVVLLMAALALVAAACGGGSEVLAEADVVAAPVFESAPEAGGGDAEGIKVHGYWTIEVRNPDGTLDDRYEFENALTDAGRSVLVALLSGPNQLSEYSTVNGYAIWALGTGSIMSNDCVGSGNSTTAGCQIGVADVAIVGDVIRLSATNEATDPGELTTVRTVIISGTIPDGGVPPGSVSGSLFTERLLDAPVSFVAGQEIEVTVEISFS